MTRPIRCRTTTFRLRSLVALALVVSYGTGCYVYRPLAAPPTRGVQVAFTLTDAGRLALGPRIGEGARELEGVVESISDSSYLLSMRGVTYINGQTNAWGGERLEVGRTAVVNPRARSFSKARTVTVAAVGIGGILAFIATRGLIGGGNDTQPGPGGPPANQ